jgi:hypothetical protein
MDGEEKKAERCMIREDKSKRGKIGRHEMGKEENGKKKGDNMVG